MGHGHKGEREEGLDVKLCIEEVQDQNQEQVEDRLIVR